jgi:hypothetical protein
LELTIEERFLASGQIILDKESIKGANDTSLRHHQIPAFLKFGYYLMDIATSPKNDRISPYYSDTGLQSIQALIRIISTRFGKYWLHVRNSM